MAAPLVVVSQQRMRIVTPSPESYKLQIRSSHYDVSVDGRVIFDISMFHRGCSVYLFDRIPLRRVADSTREKIITVSKGGIQVRRLSFQELSNLPLDKAGYHQLALSRGKAEKH
jgi:hypothetical protein